MNLQDFQRFKNTNDYLERASYTWSEDSKRIMLTASPLARSTFFYVQECGYFITTPPYFTERKNLNSFLILYTISGTGHLLYQEKEYTLTAGSCFFIHCTQYHYYDTVPASSDSTWEFLWLHFNGSSSLGYYQTFVKDGFQVLYMQDSFLIESALYRIFTLAQHKHATTETVLSNLIVNLLTELLIQSSLNETKTLDLPLYLQDIIKEIDQNSIMALNLDYFAHKYHRSKYHLSREFKKHIGITLYEYVLRARISYAKELLKYSSLSVDSIASQCGFNNVSHFINLFKAREKKTPLAFRKEWGSL